MGMVLFSLANFWVSESEEYVLFGEGSPEPIGLLRDRSEAAMAELLVCSAVLIASAVGAGFVGTESRKFTVSH